MTVFDKIVIFFDNLTISERAIIAGVIALCGYMLKEIVLKDYRPSKSARIIVFITFIIGICFLFLFRIHSDKVINDEIINTQWSNLSLEWKKCLSSQIDKNYIHIKEKDLITIRNLKTLDCPNCEITNLDPLNLTPNLEQLNISNNPIKTLDPISKLTALREVDCSHTLINNLDPLLELNNLKMLNCIGTLITTTHAQKFKSRLPNCKEFVY